jgi:RimJ/RimL family protein N-acetyltransferase
VAFLEPVLCRAIFEALRSPRNSRSVNLMSTPEATKRIRFRRYRTEDATSVSEMFADPQARRFYPDMGQPDKIERWIRWNLDSYAEHGFGLWVMEHRDDGLFLGDCGLTYQLVEGEWLLEVGYHLPEQHRGTGYATEAGRACIAYAFHELAAPLVCSVVDPDNTASIRVASRLHTSRRAFTNEKGQKRTLFWTMRQ